MGSINRNAVANLVTIITIVIIVTTALQLINTTHETTAVQLYRGGNNVHAVSLF